MGPEGQARPSAANRLRGEIEKAKADGVRREEMILRLTLSDVSRLMRDATLALEDIRFAGGVMRYLGVRVERGGVGESVLKRPEGGL